MIFAAGLGTRLKPLTDTLPKALVPVGGKPLLAHVIERLQAAGYERVVINVHHFADQIERYLRVNQNFGLDIAISDEREQLLDTGGGLKKAAPLFDPDEPVLIHNVDILDNVDYEWFARQHQPDEDVVLLVSRRKTKRYLLFDNAMRLMGWTNIETGEVKSPYPWLRNSLELRVENLEFATAVPSPDASSPTHSPSPDGMAANSSLFALHSTPRINLYPFAFSGIHSFSPRLFPLMERFPDRFPIIDFYLSTCHRARIVGLVKDDLQVLDVGKPETLRQADTLL
jgi:NDP-sugar pyrophosphorylase family protein